MCGIAVIFRDRNPDLLKKMLSKIKHRGPDEEGMWFSDDISMGHTRLSIIDISSGKQPMLTPDKKKVIVFNGEIYNFKEIQNNLKNKYSFTTNSDTEVILHLYEEKGYDCLNDLNGMFAFVIYDNGKIFAARDRIGIKPLYIAKHNDKIIFASELKCLWFADEINEFPPGSFYTSENGFQTYYKLPYPRDIHFDIDTIITNIQNLLDKAVQIRLISDVPVGVFLSGGLDSSIVAAIMKKYLPELHSFTVGVEGSEDIISARKVANYLGTIHHEYIYTETEMLQYLPDVIYHLELYDAPLVRSAVPNYFVSRLAKGIVKVLLSGEGADEIFCGYEYLKKINTDDELKSESYRITNSLQNTNLQRTDRITMSHSIEARVPFLDFKVIDFVFSISSSIKNPNFKNTEKWILRKAFENYLPSEIIWRKKQKFSEGAGSINILKAFAEKEIKDNEYLAYSKDKKIRSKEEYFYYKIFENHFPFLSNHNLIGTTKDYS